MPGVKPEMTIIKRNYEGQVMVQYSAHVLHRASNFVKVEARINHPDVPILDVILEKGDLFIEIYYTDRWYNIIEIHGHDDDHLKGWYCNIGHPAVYESIDRLSYIDLALDLWVSPGRSQTVLDEDEFAALDLDADTRDQARAALKKLQSLFTKSKNPDLS
jgi:predicted RNA-binding protein associated with RNAse of E/G family